MPAARQSESIVRLGLMAALLAALTGVACFKPRIAEGGLTCAPGGVCPEGFVCDPNLGSVCVTHLSEAGVAGNGGAAGIGGAAGLGGMGGEPPCFEPKASCAAADAGLCDPFCQTGCSGCRVKCSVNTLGALTCNQHPGTVVKGPLESCNIISADQSEQTDTCAPGHVCIEAECNRRCYQFCRDNQDCANAACERQVGDGGHKVCDVPFKACSPLIGSATVGCGGGTMACYLSSTHPDQTICDCPFGAAKEQEECQDSRDCIAGLACASRSGTKKCLRVCELAMGGRDCPTQEPDSCHPYLGATGTGGTQHATYGYCY